MPDQSPLAMYTRASKKNDTGSRMAAASAVQQHKGAALYDNRPRYRGTIEKMPAPATEETGTIQLMRGTVITGPRNPFHSRFLVRVNDTTYYGIPHGIDVQEGDIVDFDPDPHSAFLAAHIQVVHDHGALQEEEEEEKTVSDDEDYSSDEGNESEALAEDVIEKANKGRKGPAKQALRIQEMQRLRHMRGRKALERVAAAAVGIKSAPQGTFALGTSADRKFYPVTTSASAPFNDFMTSRGSEPVFNTRSKYGTGKHVHAEAAMIRESLLGGVDLRHVSVNKDFCPVCAAMLRAFDIGFNEDYVRDGFPDTWRNPFNKSTETEYWQRTKTAVTEACAGQKTKLLNCD